MTRPLRIEFPGALYHVTTRGNRREQIYLDDADRQYWNELLGNVCKTFRFAVYAYCQMGNHYHLLVRTHDGKLSRGMRYLNGEYSRHFNARHARVGHLFQGRYQAILCQDERYLLTLARYIVLNPVRAQMTAHPADWQWSSYSSTLGEPVSPHWLDASALLAHFGEAVTEARRGYVAYVREGHRGASPLAGVRHRILLGDPDEVRELVSREQVKALEDLTRTQRKLLSKPLSEFFRGVHSRDEAMAAAYQSLGYTMGEIARYCRVSTRTVSRAVAKHRI